MATTTSNTMCEQTRKVLSNYQGSRGELIPILQEVQGVIGYVPREAMSEISRFLRLPQSTVYGVVTFYSQFHLTRQGRHKIRVCQGTACHVRGCEKIIEAIRQKLGISPGETTEAFEFSLERVACVGSCALAPVISIDDKVHGNMTPKKTEKLIDQLLEKKA